MTHAQEQGWEGGDASHLLEVRSANLKSKVKVTVDKELGMPPLLLHLPEQSKPPFVGPLQSPP